MRIIAFTGMPGSGKSHAAQVARALGIPVVRMGDCVWEEVRARGLALSDADVGRVAQEMRDTHGPGIWAERTLAKVRSLGAPQVVIDGVRSMSEVLSFKEALGHDFVLVAMEASPDTRHQRLAARKREDEAATPADLAERDRRELSWGIADVIRSADVTLHNEGGDAAGLRAQVERLLRGP